MSQIQCNINFLIEEITRSIVYDKTCFIIISFVIRMILLGVYFYLVPIKFNLNMRKAEPEIQNNDEQTEDSTTTEEQANRGSIERMEIQEQNVSSKTPTPTQQQLQPHSAKPWPPDLM